MSRTRRRGPTAIRRSLGLAVMAGVTFALLAVPAQAAPGDGDPTFSADGKTMTDFTGGPDSGSDLALQPDGKIVVVGRTPGGGGDFALARYKQNGALDESFSGDGKTRTDFLGDSDGAHAVALQPDGKIVVAGLARRENGNPDSDDFALARYKPNGALDESFSGDGKTRTDFAAGEDFANGVVIQPDGRIVVVGQIRASQDNIDFGVVRYKANGALDESFSGDGKRSTDFGSEVDRGQNIELQRDGKIVVGGSTERGGGDNDFALARYTPNGAHDETFAGNGRTRTDFAGGSDTANDIVLQPDGKVVAGGQAQNGTVFAFGLARYTPNGALDPGFSGDGRTTTDFGPGGDGAAGVALQRDGKIVAAGFTNAGGGNFDFALARYRANGAHDLGFAGDGQTTTDFAEARDSANGVAIQPDGKIVAAGDATGRDGDENFGLARYLGGG